jgi:anti-anti-sigma regulatory factor
LRNVMMPNTETGSPPRWGSLEIGQAEVLQEELLRVLGSSVEPVLDLSHVESCDAAGAQLLISARKSAELLGKTLRLRDPSPALRQSWERLGLPLVLLEDRSHDV